MSQIPVFDGHNDTLTKPDHDGFAAGRPGGHVDLARMREGGMRGGIFAMFTPAPPGRDELDQPTAAGDATAAAGRLFALEQEGVLRVARSISDVDAAASGDGPPVAVLHIEGAEAIDPGLEALDLWHAAGLRSLGPVWSRSNAFAHGVPLRNVPTSPDIGPGLTAAGERLVRRCGELGIVVDLSHLNEAGFWDVARLEAGPLVASHSGAHAIAPSSRNLTDDQLEAIGDSDGLVGIVFGARFLRPDLANDANTPIALIAEHARYVADLVGFEHVALGSDFDGTTIPAALGGAEGLPKVLRELSAAGFSDHEVEAIAWDNWRRVLAAWWS